ncbi:MAG: hypothetical protein QF790_08035 [Gammaproteobacteria bacterium]|nr:hypothetical protein [Gammaproteobacteria bacterium]MDP6617095.1 hypothetical protein [Gammaproteobacteria bacterium]
MGFAGYTLIGFIDSPLDSATYPLFALLGLGQLSTLVGSQTLVAKAASPEIRGSVIGTFGFWGAIGIVLSAFFGGRLFDSVSPSAPFIMLGVLQGVLLVIAIFVLFRKE